MYLTTVSLNYNFMCFAVTNEKKIFRFGKCIKAKIFTRQLCTPEWNSQIFYPPI